jgi:hypothetical protein
MPERPVEGREIALEHVRANLFFRRTESNFLSTKPSKTEASNFSPR